MGSYPDEFPFGIMEVVELLHLRVRRQQANSVYVDCPFCGDRRGRMNVNFVKNVWRCNHCDEHGGMLALYAKFNHTTTSDAYWEIAVCGRPHFFIRQGKTPVSSVPVSAKGSRIPLKFLNYLEDKAMWQRNNGRAEEELQIKFTGYLIQAVRRTQRDYLKALYA